MERLEINHSLKDIPIPTKDNYLLILTAKMEDLIHRMRWKAHLSDKEIDPNSESKFNFKSQKTPPKCKYLEPFELDLLDLVNRIEFDGKISKYQRKLQNLVGTIKRSKKIWVKADKTNNFYQIEKKTST